jgi:signal transduction histidine kinase
MDKQLEKAQKQLNELKADTNEHLNEVKESIKKR